MHCPLFAVTTVLEAVFDAEFILYRYYAVKVWSGLVLFDAEFTFDRHQFWTWRWVVRRRQLSREHSPGAFEEHPFQSVRQNSSFWSLRKNLVELENKLDALCLISPQGKAKNLGASLRYCRPAAKEVSVLKSESCIMYVPALSVLSEFTPFLKHKF